VSGAAYGCDQAAQRAALEAEGRTVAVLGCGADVDYPRATASLIDVIRRRGAVVSELAWGHPPARWAFPNRNRIIAALAAAVLVVEAGLPSGTFSTADHALDAGRQVLAVPGSVFAPECRGSNRLIRQGATPVTDISELAQELRACGLLEADGPDGVPFAVPAEDRLARALLADPMRPDDVARALALDVVDVMRRIGRLEASGVVRRYPDGRYGAG
jgi:DNA processing protein